MYKPSLKSNSSIVLLGLLSIILFTIAQTSYKTTQADYFAEKQQASQLMKQYMNTIREAGIASGNPTDQFDDPAQSGIIGPRLSTITTSPAVLSEKQTAVNPNLAAIYVQLLKDAHVKEGQYVAVGLTGSNPGMNLALYAAMEVLKVHPVIITALGSSMYGANNPAFTWLDMETVLKNKGMLHFSTSYASLGGNDDLASKISAAGVQDLKDAMTRNHVQLVPGSTLDESIANRMKIYEKESPEGKRYHLFVNIGSGIANIGSSVNARLVKEGLNRKLAEKDFAQPGVMMLFAKRNVPVLHEVRVLRLAKKYQLPTAPDRIPEVGQGIIFGSKIHNVLVSWICLILLAAAIVTVVVFDRSDRHFMSNIVDPDEEL